MASQKVFLIEELVKTDELGKPVHRTIEVPDGMWVADAGTHYRNEEEWDEESSYTQSISTSFETIGGGMIAHYRIDRAGGNSGTWGSSCSWGSSLTKLVSDRPFGVIHTEKENGIASPYHAFRAARQIHKGELGRFPMSNQPRYAREGRELSDHVPEDVKCTRLHDRRRHHARWARLVEVAALMGMPHEQLVASFYPFADSEGRGLPILFASTFKEIDRKVIAYNAVQRFTERDLPRLFDRNPANIWVRQGFAKTVLCLHTLGYRPTTAVAQAA